MTVLPIEHRKSRAPDPPFTANQGLVFAEIELPHEDTFFERPAWVFREVTHLSRYYNSNLGSHPYSTWTEAEKAALDGTTPV